MYVSLKQQMPRFGVVVSLKFLMKIALNLDLYT